MMALLRFCYIFQQGMFYFFNGVNRPIGDILKMCVFDCQVMKRILKMCFVRLTDQLRMLLAGWPSPWSRPASAGGVSSR